MPVAVTYAGVPFLLPDDRVMERLRRHMPADYLPDLGCVPPDWPGAWATTLGLPRPPAPPQPLGVGDFFYPCGASRCAVYRGLMTGRHVAILDGILDASPLYPRRPRTFKIQATDGTAYVETPLHMLPPRACAEFDADPDRRLYLVTLVDERFLWPGFYGGHVSSGGGWAAMFTWLAQSLGLSSIAGTSSIETDYQFGPDFDGTLGRDAGPAAPKLEAMAFSVGRGVVRSLAGAYSLQRWADATHAAATGVWGGLHTGGGPGLDYTMVPGRFSVFRRNHSRWYSNRDHRAYAGSAPAAAQIDRPYGYGNADSLGIATPTDVFTTASLGPPYASYPVGIRGGNGVFHSLSLYTTYTAVHSGGHVFGAGAAVENATQAAALARRMAKDYLDFVTTPRIDRTLAGVVAVTPTASTDVVWSVRADGHGEGQATTRVVSVPWDWYPAHLHHAQDPTTQRVRSTSDLHDTGLWATVVSGSGLGPYTWVMPHLDRAESFAGVVAADRIAGGSNAFQVFQPLPPGDVPAGATVRLYPDRLRGSGVGGLAPQRYWFDWRALSPPASPPPPPPPPATCGGIWLISPSAGPAPLDVTLAWDFGLGTASLFVEWGDGTAQSLPLFSGSTPHTYATAGEYDAKVTWTCTDGPGSFGTQRVKAEDGLPPPPAPALDHEVDTP